MNSLWKRYGLFGLLTALAVGLDQWTKRLAVENLMGNGPFVIWDGVFELLYSENRGQPSGSFRESTPSFSWWLRR